MRRAIIRFVASLEDSQKYHVFIAVIVALCIVAICIGIYVDKYYKYSEIDPLMMGIRIGNKKSAEEIVTLKASFNELFSNDVKSTADEDSEEYNFERINESLGSIVYNAYDLQQDTDFYNVDADIPQLNINAENAKKINQEIYETYYKTAYIKMRNIEGMTVYNVKFAAFVNNTYLSLVIKSTLKEDSKPEKVMIKTYNYNMATDSLFTIEDLIKLKNETNESIQDTITKEIQTSDANAKILAKEYGALYTRNLESEIYKVKNTENFFLTQDGYVYIVYAYGNTDDTNEMDIVIF
ncbi:MAG: hypothetical protein K6D97_05785 [Clostridia bacterium]|nr:hypothetical protein [Clostridia bacterium]